jgi:hypothetical protein
VALASLVAILHFTKKYRFQGTPLPLALVMDIARIKNITSRTIQTTGILILIINMAAILDSADNILP